MSISLEALILAGGNSSRMGQDKALLSHPGSGQPLLTHLCEISQVHCQQVSVLTPRIAQYQPLLPPGCRCLQESRPHSASPLGPLIAFREGLTRLQASWILLLACDLPGLKADTIGGWLPSLAHASPKTIALLPRGSKGWEPLCGFYRRRALTSLDQAIAQNKRSFQRWLATETVEPLTIQDSSTLQNCNTPEEWGQFQQQFS